MGVVLALLSSAMWGTADFLGGTMSRRLRALAVVLGSQTCALGVMVVVATVTGSWGAPLDYLPWGLAAGVTGLSALVLFYRALAIGTMGIVSPVASIGTLVPLGLGLLQGQLPTGGQYFGIALALVGVVLACGPELSGAASPKPVLLALGSALGFGLALSFIALGSEHNVVMTMTTMRVVSLVVTVAVVAVTRSTGGVTARDIPMLTVVGGFDVLANVSFGLASGLALLPVVAVLGSLYPVATVLLAWRVLGERLALVQYVGVSVALLGVAVISAMR